MPSASDLRPTEGNVLVRGIRPTETKGGVAIPDTYREENPRAEVVSLNPKDESDYAVGDTVYIVQMHGVVPLKFDGEEYFLVSKESILAYVTDPARN